MTAISDIALRALKFIIAALLALMVVMVFGNVVLRYGFNSGITVSEELSRWSLVWLIFLGAIVALKEHQHLGMDFAVRMLPHGGRLACYVVSHLLMIYATWLLLKGSWQQTLLNWDVPAPVTGMSTGLFYGIGVVFAVPAIAILANDLFRALAGKISDEELIEIKESEEETDVAKLAHSLEKAGPLAAETPVGRQGAPS
jgi:TRAP-type C4-dicarboxylate transport system permease small subunit